MENFNKGPKPLINWTAMKSYKDEGTYNKIRRHLEDINDTITEEDIRNIKIDELFVSTASAFPGYNNSTSTAK
ncbi:MAG: hypothetical protein JST81_01385 [Bacteroidetes bacterium]|jgi:hypothetical protein|nr:hypothetical protein [Bacteroidota bacterium]